MRYFGIFGAKSTPRRMAATGLTALAISGLLSPAGATAESVTCQDVIIPVSLAGVRQTVYGSFCRPTQPTSTVLLLVPGATYTSAYWDLPASLGLISFRAGMNGRGYAKVIIGGHSLGAAISLIEAASFHDVDGVLTAGFAHQFDPIDSATDLIASLSPAALDPLLSKRNYDPGYLTTRPGTRQRAFHRPAQPSAAVMAYEESTKDAFAATELADAAVATATPYSLLIDVPVLVAIGGRDELYRGPLVGLDCTSAATIYRDEAPFYSPAARLRTFLLPGAYGHSFNFAPNADVFYRAVAQWSDETVGH